VALKKITQKIKYPIFWEITGFFILIVLVNIFLLPHDPGFRDLQKYAVNPFIFLILLTVVRYGTLWGYYATIISALYFAFTPPYGISHFFERLPMVALYFILLLIFGRIHDNFASRIKRLEEEIEETKTKFRQLNEQFEVVSFLKDNYERKILTRPTTMADLYKDAERMSSLDPDALYTEMLEVIKKYTEAQKCSLYLLEGNKLILKNFSGYEDFDSKPRLSLDIAESPYSIVLEKKELVSIKQEGYKEAILTRIPIFTGPLKNGEGDMLGIITIDAISMLKFNPITRKTFAMLCDWASKALENAIMYKETEGRRIIDPDLQIYRFHYFALRLEEALFQVQRKKTPFAFLMIEILNWDKILEKYKKATLKFTARILGQNLREFDILARSEKENEFLLLLPDSPKEGVESLVGRISKQVETFNLKPFEENYAFRLQVRYSADQTEGKSIETLIAGVQRNTATQIIIPLQ
jgi:GGDEF domain-containing protein